jgi:IS5 family transposase
MIQEHPYPQYFCGYPGYDDEYPPFDPSLMVYFRKRLTPEALGEINEMILDTIKQDEKHDDDDHGGDGNSGTMIVDATCAPSNISYPQDASLLNEARENSEKLLDELHDPSDGRKPRTYRSQAYQDYLQFSRSRKKTAKKVCRAVGKQLRDLARNLAAIDKKLALGRSLSGQKGERLTTIRTLYEQHKYMYDHRCHSL